MIVSATAVILIVSAREALVASLHTLLGDKGELHHAAGGHAALDMARKLRPALLLVDEAMGDIGAGGFCRAVRADSELASAAILCIVTGEDAETAALQFGASDVLPRPLRPAVVRTRVEIQLTLQRQHAAMRRLSHQDGLTGVFNSWHFDERLARELQRHRRHKLPLGIALIDIDHFESYNTALGHETGDACLYRVAQVLGSASRRPGEMAARYGGDRFAVLLPGTDRAEMEKFGLWVCDRVRALALPHPGSTVSPVVTVSAGLVTRVPDTLENEKLLLAGADRALDLAKSRGRDRYEIGDAGPRTAPTLRLV
jgi:diguanylate cyclase (GGDEF)-like protein